MSPFNEPIADWLSFFMFTMFTDRDGKYQLLALAESGFDPLARTTRFMLMEEAHHMYVGESGVGRIIHRTCEVMLTHKTDDPTRLRALGVIDLPTLQCFLNFHFSLTIDLFGADVTSNAATFYSSGLKGRYGETKYGDDHVLRDAMYPVLQFIDGRIAAGEAPALNALNEKLRDDYIKDSVAGVGRWNRIIHKAGIPFELTVPHKAFNRKIGLLAGLKLAPHCRIATHAEGGARQWGLLRTQVDRAL